MISLPFFLQGALGRSDVTTGLLLTPWPLATMIMAPLAGRLVERIHAGILGGIGMTIFATGLFLLAILPDKYGYYMAPVYLWSRIRFIPDTQ